MTDAPQFPARRGPAEDGYRLMFLVPRQQDAKDSNAQRQGSAPGGDSPPRRPVPPRKPATRDAGR